MIRPMPQPAAPAVTRAAPQPASVLRTTSATPGKTAGKAPPVDVAAPVDVRDLTVPGGPVGQTWLRTFRRIGASGVLPSTATRTVSTVLASLSQRTLPAATWSTS